MIRLLEIELAPIDKFQNLLQAFKALPPKSKSKIYVLEWLRKHKGAQLTFHPRYRLPYTAKYAFPLEVISSEEEYKKRQDFLERHREACLLKVKPNSAEVEAVYYCKPVKALHQRFIELLGGLQMMHGFFSDVADGRIRVEEPPK